MGNNKDIFFDIALINDIVDGLADPKTESDFSEHIKECANCRSLYEETLKVKSIIKEDGFIPGAEELPSESFTQKVMQKIRKAKRPLIIRIINHPAVKTACVAAACLLFAIFVHNANLISKLDIDDYEGIIDSEESSDVDLQAPDASLYDETYDTTETTTTTASKSYDTVTDSETPAADNSVMYDDSEDLYNRAESDTDTENSTPLSTSSTAYPSSSTSGYDPKSEEPESNQSDMTTEATNEAIVPENSAEDMLDDDFFTDAENDVFYYDIIENAESAELNEYIENNFDVNTYANVLFVPYSESNVSDWNMINSLYGDSIGTVTCFELDGHVYEVYEWESENILLSEYESNSDSGANGTTVNLFIVQTK